MFPTLTCGVFVFSAVSAPSSRPSFLPPPPSLHSLTFTHSHTLTNSHTHTHSLSHTHSHTLTLTHSLTHNFTSLTHSHSLTHTHSHTHSLLHTHTHTLSHTHSLSHTHFLGLRASVLLFGVAGAGLAAVQGA